MSWVPIAAWIAAAVIALVVLGFCAYEISWKARRLQHDLAALDHDREQVEALQAAMAHTRDRVTAARRS